MSTDSFGKVPDDAEWIVYLAFFCMVYMAWGIGANDCANNFASAWGSGALSFKACIGISFVLEATGAIFLGSDVQTTFRKGIVDRKLYEKSGNDGRCLVYVGMTAVLFSAATWLLIACTFGLPVSTTHSAVGGVISFGILTKGYEAVLWNKVGLIVASWFCSPAMSWLTAFFLFTFIKKFVLSLPEESQRLRRTAQVAPVMAFITAFVIALFVMYKGAKGVGTHKTELGTAFGIAAGIAFALTLLSYPVVMHVRGRLEKNEAAKIEALEKQKTAEENEVKEIQKTEEGSSKTDAENANFDSSKINIDDIPEFETLSPTEKLWASFCWLTASFEALAHGGNDVANSVAPFAAVLASKEGALEKKSEVPMWVFIVAGFAIAIGLATFGKRVMITIGRELTPLQPSQAFAAELSATAVILVATKLGIPISTTHASVGAVMGVGTANLGYQGIDWKVMLRVFGAWVFTIPIVAVFTAGTYGFLLPMLVESPIV